MDFPVDIVYLWCDSAEAGFRARLNEYRPCEAAMGDDAGDSRFISNDELRFSLRSLVKNANWIRHVFIVTDRQRPQWLADDNARLTVVDHSEIIDAQFLPLFNSPAIESQIYRIDGLAEHFLYANDDMLITRPADKGFFFTPNGRPIVRLKHQKLGPGRGTYQDKIRHMQEMVAKAYGRRYKLAPHHNIDAYLRSVFKECMESHADMVEATLRNRFRSPADIQRSLVGYTMLARGQAAERKVGRLNRCRNACDALRCLLTGRYCSDSRCEPMAGTDFAHSIRKYAPTLYAINDDSRTQPSDRLRTRAFLQQMFPEPSPFERAD